MIAATPDTHGPRKRSTPTDDGHLDRHGHGFGDAERSTVHVRRSTRVTCRNSTDPAAADHRVAERARPVRRNAGIHVRRTRRSASVATLRRTADRAPRLRRGRARGSRWSAPRTAGPAVMLRFVTLSVALHEGYGTWPLMSANMTPLELNKYSALMRERARKLGATAADGSFGKATRGTRFTALLRTSFCVTARRSECSTRRASTPSRRRCRRARSAYVRLKLMAARHGREAWASFKGGVRNFVRKFANVVPS
jgi:hypothetical protein